MNESKSMGSNGVHCDTSPKESKICEPELKDAINQEFKHGEQEVVDANGKEPKDTDETLIKIGYKFYKRFEDGEFYNGEVIGNEEVEQENSEGTLSVWRIRYAEDGEEEDMTTQEVLACPQENPRSKKQDSPKALTDIPQSYGRDDHVGKRTRARETEVKIGYRFFKCFEDDEFYTGEVIGEEMVRQEGTDDIISIWRIRYVEDGEEEDMTTLEVLEWPQDNPRLKQQSKKKARLENKQQPYDKARRSLLQFPGVTEEEAMLALDHVGPPFGLQAAMNHIQRLRDLPDQYKNVKKFSPHIGMKVRKYAGGAQYVGEVTSAGRMMELPDMAGKIRMWEVTYEDGEMDDLDWYQLLQARADRPNRSHPCRGRQLNCLEIFSGCGLVSQEFVDHRWRARSVDTDLSSHASDKVSIMDFSFETVGFVPDFIWASPPCFTYSLMAGGKHRGSEPGTMEKSPAALEQNHLFAKMSQILYAAKKKMPHLVVVIENPVGLLSKMSLMKELEKVLGLYRCTVDYCAFGRSDKKPTHLWTNDFGLYSTLSEFRCSKKCPYKDGVHPVSTRGHGNGFNAAAIPDALAEEVAEYVNAKFVLDRIRHTEMPSVV